MIKYTCRKMTKTEIAKLKKESFQDISSENATAQIGPDFLQNTPELNIKPIVKNSVNQSLFPKICPQSYHKIGDICCPVYLENGKCPQPNSVDKTRYNGMPICALNYVTAANWGKNYNTKSLRLCSELPQTIGSFKRNTVNKICDSGNNLIDGKCYKKCPEGFVSEKNKCVPKEFTRIEINSKCPKDSELTADLCFKKCPFGFQPFNNYCVPNDLANL